MAGVGGVATLAPQGAHLLAVLLSAGGHLPEVLHPDVQAHLEPGVVNLAALQTPEEEVLLAKYSQVYSCT